MGDLNQALRDSVWFSRSMSVNVSSTFPLKPMKVGNGGASVELSERL